MCDRKKEKRKADGFKKLNINTYRFLYVMTDGMRSKIGVSGRPNVRALDLSYSERTNIDVYYVWASSNAFRVEQQVKNVVKPHTIGSTEWTSLAPWDLVRLAEEQGKRFGVMLMTFDKDDACSRKIHAFVDVEWDSVVLHVPFKRDLTLWYLPWDVDAY